MSNPSVTGQRPIVILLPRDLIFLASLWLIASWILAIGLQRPLQPSTASYTPSVRALIICVVTGLTIGWPLLRLSQRRTSLPCFHTVLDVFVLLALVQVVIWPLRLVTPWSVTRTALIDLTIAGWTLLIAAVVSQAVASPHRHVRTMATGLCIALCTGGPMLSLLVGRTSMAGQTLMYLSPFGSIHTLARDVASGPGRNDWQLSLIVTSFALMAWVAVLVRAAHVRMRNGGVVAP